MTITFPRTILYLSFFLILSLGGYFLYRTTTLESSRTRLPQVVLESPSPESLAWPTYTDSERRWSLRYPPELGINPLEVVPTIGRHITWYYQTTIQVEDCGGICPNKSVNTVVHLPAGRANKIFATMEGPNVTTPQSVVCYQLPTQQGDYFLICAWELPLDQVDSLTISGRTPKAVDPSHVKALDQIALSLQF